MLTISSSELPSNIRDRLIGGDISTTEYCITNLNEAINEAQAKFTTENTTAKAITEQKFKRKGSRLTSEQRHSNTYFTSITPSTYVSTYTHISFFEDLTKLPKKS